MNLLKYYSNNVCTFLQTQLIANIQFTKLVSNLTRIQSIQVERQTILLRFAKSLFQYFGLRFFGKTICFLVSVACFVSLTLVYWVSDTELDL